MNPELLSASYNEATQQLWRRTRIVDRAQGIIAHELAENEHSGNHELALIARSDTRLLISHRARELLRQMERGSLGC